MSRLSQILLSYLAASFVAAATLLTAFSVSALIFRFSLETLAGLIASVFYLIPLAFVIAVLAAPASATFILIAEWWKIATPIYFISFGALSAVVMTIAYLPIFADNTSAILSVPISYFALAIIRFPAAFLVVLATGALSGLVYWKLSRRK